MAARLTALPLRWLGIGAGALALAASSLFHGLDSSASAGIPQVKPNTVSRDGPWNVNVLTCRVVTDLSPYKPQKDGDRWFVVIAYVNVTADESQTSIGAIIRIPQVQGLTATGGSRGKPPDHILLVRDGSEVQYLNPGMTERVGFAWEQSPSAPMPSETLVQVYGETLRESALSGNEEWLDLSVHAEVHASIEDRRS
ncbi:hypothetical protein Raf01_19860 [Rugosimonospora africana]|uniref:Uncharacterized protein n=2 Tax=Rugosimonospora africana TaxID=556532 RepID=A0A8J3QMS0_9ACTN|nr:hypothetical protein Raf01_19860 [Rugosimonospora africana]